MKIYEGQRVATGLRALIVASRFNGIIVERLVEGALEALAKHGAERDDQAVAWVPGAHEIPLIAKRGIERLAPDAVICLGCVIRGGTGHYEHVANAASSGIARVSLDTGVPVTNGVLTVEDLEQALERAGGKMGNKGAEAAIAAIETTRLLASFQPLKK